MEIRPSEQHPKEWVISEHAVNPAFEKDYDAFPNNHPGNLEQQFDLTNWGLLYALVNGQKVGAALIAFQTSNVDMLENRQDLAVLWDIRIDKNFRGKGIGSSLFNAVKVWAAAHNCTELKIETQNTNASAVKFYLKQGCELRYVNKEAYPDLPDEYQLLFYKNLQES